MASAAVKSERRPSRAKHASIGTATSDTAPLMVDPPVPR